MVPLVHEILFGGGLLNICLPLKNVIMSLFFSLVKKYSQKKIIIIKKSSDIKETRDFLIKIKSQQKMNA